MTAKIEGYGPLMCYCLNRNSKLAYTFTRPNDFCDAWEDGEYGAIDDPDAKGAYR